MYSKKQLYINKKLTLKDSVAQITQSANWTIQKTIIINYFNLYMMQMLKDLLKSRMYYRKRNLK